jgi:Phytanoyl-CoA dioxygenase (PhyH)
VSFVERVRPRDDVELRRALYDGRVFLLPATGASMRLVDLARERLQFEIGSDPRHAHARYGDAELFERIGRVRLAIYTEPVAHDLLRETAATAGFAADETAFDPARLRAILHGAADNPRAAPVYYPHRDTWYGHPMCAVTMWTALDDLGEDETFVFHPARFRAPVANDSEIFDYDAWVARGWSLKIGWQDREASLRERYPGVVGHDDWGPAEGFSCRAGDVLVFSSAQFHRTLPQASGKSRFSLDARLVHLGDEACGLGAVNVDGRSRGSALRDYVGPVPARG